MRREKNPEAYGLDTFALEMFKDISCVKVKHADPAGVPETLPLYLATQEQMVDFLRE